MNNPKPTFANGKICYIEIPALNSGQSASFYQNVFSWSIREDNDGNMSFDDGAGEVSGMWVTGRQPHNGGIMVSIMVYNLQDTINLVKQNGGSILENDYPAPSGNTAFFKDPAGNVFCLYQHNKK
jgi:predicted enzyme related to lactoylglutathione lyase